VVKDCSFIDMDANLALHINSCFTNESVFKISNDVKKEEIPLLSFDYVKKQWLVGRYIGELFFAFKGQDYCLEVTPRFGNATILNLLEEIFKVKLATNSASNTLKNEQHNHLIKKLISLIWIKELSKANVHGLPKKKININYVGNTVKGKIDIRKSIIPLYNENKIVSNKIEKTTDVVIQSILYKAYNLLCKEYFLTQNMLTENVKDVLNTTNQNSSKNVTTNEYEKIRYGAMYIGYKNIVDFSWEIIQRKKNALLQKNANKNTDALFLDMAEIWENYLVAVFKKKYQTEGWKVYSKKYYAYQNQSFKRGLIPDIILEKDNEVIVWDAKYKNMEFGMFDYDRADFFQIHTYGSFMESQNKKVIGLGLLYPFKNEINEHQIRQNFSKTLFDAGNNSTWFKVDGITLPEKNDELIINRNNFIKRIDAFMTAKNN
jgi:hypothetical protein